MGKRRARGQGSALEGLGGYSLYLGGAALIAL